MTKFPLFFSIDSLITEFAFPIVSRASSLSSVVVETTYSGGAIRFI